MNALLIFTLFILGCSSQSHRKYVGIEPPYSYENIVLQYSDDYFVGIGMGIGNTKELAIKMAKIQAQAQLADNIKVTIISKSELIYFEHEVDGKFESSEKFKQKIISLGNAILRSPEYELLDIMSDGINFKANVLMKKSKKEHIELAARDLGFLEDSAILLELIK